MVFGKHLKVKVMNSISNRVGDITLIYYAAAIGQFFILMIKL